MAFNPTPAQEQAIQNRGALLVSAAAGSGKTAVLVERVVQCVMDTHRPVDIDRFLVVTFTNAAASEMRERIRRRLAEESAKDPDNLRLLRQQMLLQKANICTIDSFCKNLITEHFAALDLSPDFQLISANALTVLKQSAMDETLNFFFETRGEDFTRLAQTLGADQDVYHLQTAMEKIYSYLRSLPFPEDWSNKVCRSYRDFTTVEQSVWGKALMQRAHKTVSRSIRSLQGVLREIVADPKVQEKRGDLIRTALLQIEAVRTALDRQNWDETVSACKRLEPISYQGAALRGDCDGQIKQMTVSAQTMVASLRDSLQKTFFMTAEECKQQCDLLAPLVELLLDAVWEYSRRIDAKKKEQNALDFSDLEYGALRLLVQSENGTAKPTAYGETLWQNYDYVMVDEYQDVNNLQSEIFHAISHGGENLFTVGDVKQSIYRFRKANPQNFMRMFRSYPDYDGQCSPAKLVLDGNFRSRQGICQTVNGLFSCIMSEYAGELDYDQNHALTALGSFPADSQPPVELAFIETDEQRASREIEADFIARRIVEATKTPCVTDDGALRPARYGDCVILMRSLKDKAEIYVERLRQHGIPAVAEQAGGFFDRPEVLQVISLLQTVNNPTDDVALLSCMMSGMFGFSADEVAGIRGKNKKIPLYLSVENAARQGNVKAQELLTTLGQLRVYGATVSTAQLLDEIYDRYGYLSAVRVMENGAQCRQNLLTLRELAAECDQNGFDRIDGFIRYLDKLKDQHADVGTSASTATDAVRIMSIHHSKGLQFPICIVAGCSGRFNRSESTAPVLLDEQLGLGLTLTDDQKQMRTATCMRLAVAAENLRAEQSEELRVLYVALTRGIDRLIVTACIDHPEKTIADHAAALAGNVDEQGRLDPELVLSASSYQNLLLYFALLHPSGHLLRTHANTDFGFLNCDESHCTVSLMQSKEIPSPADVTEEQVVFPSAEELTQTICQRLNYVDPYAPLQTVFSKRSVSQLVHGVQPQLQPRMPRPSFLQKDGLTAAERGTALHEFMQYADYANACCHMEEELHRLEQQNFLTARQVQCIQREKLQRFFGSTLYQRMSASPRVMREYRFMSAIPATRLDPTLPDRFSDEQVVVQGITDCVFEEDGALIVVDYKTDRVKTPQELIDRYALQLQLYAEMLTETLHKPVKELLLYSFALDTQVAVELN